MIKKTIQTITELTNQLPCKENARIYDIQQMFNRDDEYRNEDAPVNHIGFALSCLPYTELKGQIVEAIDKAHKNDIELDAESLFDQLPQTKLFYPNINGIIRLPWDLTDADNPDLYR